MNMCAAVLHLVQETWFVVGRSNSPRHEQNPWRSTPTSLTVMTEETRAGACPWGHGLDTHSPGNETKVGNNHPHSIRKARTVHPPSYQTTSGEGPHGDQSFFVSHLPPTKVYFKTLYTETHTHTHTNILFLTFWGVLLILRQYRLNS